MKTTKPYHTNIQDIKLALRQPFTFPGCYPIHFLASNGDTLCHKCVKENIRDVFRESKESPKSHHQWNIEPFPHFEGTLFCSECSTELESAYGDPQQT